MSGLGWPVLSFSLASGAALGCLFLLFRGFSRLLGLKKLGTALLDVLYKNYIRTARAKGLRESAVLFGQALKNAAPTILTVVGQSFGSLVTGTIVTETIFNIPGLGMLTMSSINQRDVFVIQGVVLFVTVIYVLVNLAVDILYGLVDPRLQLGRQ